VDWRVYIVVNHLSRDVLPSPLVLGLRGLSKHPYLARSSALMLFYESEISVSDRHSNNKSYGLAA